MRTITVEILNEKAVVLLKIMEDLGLFKLENDFF